MTNAHVFDMPMELGLKLVTVIGSDFTDGERKLFDEVVDVRDGTGLGMAGADLGGGSCRPDHQTSSHRHTLDQGGGASVARWRADQPPSARTGNDGVVFCHGQRQGRQ